ncbi:FRG domain-containing protein [Stappia sp. GBMRC 2046]|uniref:FRG domain-containing protein n=1 Tax=Stappia sediminis TaxID=2692190 RepID=A0A7X3LUH4_9HYPH|nr:FRG domain-containing protein [Stappia sediminis]MXN65290.1 FRG domain-containing protein [Stappia sediminis]
MKIKKFSQFIGSIEKFRQKAAHQELWYRGHGSEKYLLEPFLHRNRKAANIDEIEQIESDIYAEFARRSPLYDTYQREKWDMLFLMQHYRAPTRLLDWTSSPLIALFFALMGGDSDNDSTIWCLDPAAWNGIVLKDISEEPRIFTTEERLVDQYHPLFREKSSRNEPLAIQGIINNPRINAQKGRFVIFSSVPRTLEEHASDYKIKDNGPILHKLNISKDAKRNILRDLESYGITYSTIFPDLEGLAVEIRRQYEA